MRRPFSAFTLAEALLTVALVFFVFSLTAGLLTSYLRTVRFSGGVEKTLEAAQNVLGAIRVEAAQALSVSSPGTGASSTLRFSKVWTDAPSRLPDPLAPFPASWEPRDSAWLDTVTYSFSTDRLLRSSVREQVNAVLLADQISEFQVRTLPNGNLLVDIATRQGTFERRFSSEIFTGLLR